MGEKSFGKGSVQTVVQTGPESALRLTTARLLLVARLTLPR